MPMKQNVRFQGTMQPEKNRIDQIQNCHYLLSYALYFGNRARCPDHHYETKSEVSGEDAP